MCFFAADFATIIKKRCKYQNSTNFSVKIRNFTTIFKVIHNMYNLKYGGKIPDFYGIFLYIIWTFPGAIAKAIEKHD